jgi:hypothetical protein
VVKNRSSFARQRGVTYFWALLMVLFITLGLGKLLENVAMTNKRNRETELLYIGNLYRDAIRQYSQSTPVGAKPYPEKLGDLPRRSVKFLRVWSLQTPPPDDRRLSH